MRPRHVSRAATLLLAALVLSTLAPRRAAAQRSEPAPVTGRVTDETGRALEGVRVASDEGREAVTDADGRFTLRVTTCDPVRLTVRRPGSVGVTRVVDACAAPAPVTIALRPIATRLSAVQVRAKVSGVVGEVTDRAGTPLANVEVALLGAREAVRTDSAGRFAILDVRPGGYLLSVRDPRFVAQRISVGLQEGDVRELLVLLWPIPHGASEREARNASGFGLDEWWFRDLARRRAWGGVYSIVASREELLATGERDLPCALSRVRRTQQVFMRLTSGNCPQWTPPIGCIVVDGRWDYPHPLWAIRTKDVELVELYRAGSDFSRSTLTRAQNCPSGQDVAVVWTH